MGNKLGRKRQIVDERYTKPQQGLYMSKDVDVKMLKRLILDSKLAPCYPGLEETSSHHDLEECPICFLVCFCFLKVFPFLLHSSFNKMKLTHAIFSSCYCVF